MSGHWSEILRKDGACGAAIQFARRHETLKAAWDACPNEGWLIWLLETVESKHRVPARVMRVLREKILATNCQRCRDRVVTVSTWSDLAAEIGAFAVHLDPGVEALRAIFPNPPRFRNGAGE